ncbi:avirulence protein [Xanthomonas populi]|uniref:Avirulence protein n=1 Tax=Xanthomonas populi TaxID=53414 RepID=A0A2S7E913_9XANT|nr:AvrBs1/Avra family type III secretion system effector [Xanthomonas populi]PPU86649.1 avirulence protein [Xanthomonas populi]
MKTNSSTAKIYVRPCEEENDTQHDSPTTSGLVMPSVDAKNLKNAPRKKYLNKNIAALQTPELERVHQKKVALQNLAQFQIKLANTKCKNELEQLIDDPSVKEGLLKVDSGISEEYGQGKPLMIRSLRFSNPQEMTVGFGAKGKTPAKREIDTVCNKSTQYDIVMTPASLISKDVRMNLISQLTRPKDKQKYNGLPSVIYGECSSRNIVGSLASRNGFGDVHSFKSNNGFNSDYEKIAEFSSHAEKLGAIERNLIPYMRLDSDRSSCHFVHSVDELAKAQSILQSKRPLSSLRHNEFCTKLELWDAKAIAVGESRPLAVSTLIEFNLEMLSIAREISNEWHENKMISEFIERQLSWLGQQAALDKKATLKMVSALTIEQRESIANDICLLLRRGVSLCTYEKNITGSHICEISLLDFSVEEIVEGINIFLSSKFPD